uniref:Uncharacterized protein n=1 Tax=Onchocerca volvulus TaxID=6282 RepID=A0A8R1Y203_ONCVO
MDIYSKILKNDWEILISHEWICCVCIGISGSSHSLLHACLLFSINDFKNGNFIGSDPAPSVGMREMPYYFVESFPTIFKVHKMALFAGKMLQTIKSTNVFLNRTIALFLYRIEITWVMR